MKVISMLELRQNSEAVVEDLRRGQTLTLTYRGRPLARLTPIGPADDEISSEDPFYTLAVQAADGAEENGTAGNAQIDQTLYGQA